MRVAVTNEGPTRSFPTRLGDIFLSRGETKAIDDEDAANELTKYPQLKFEFKTGLEAPAAGPRADKPKAIDWAAMRLQDLRAIAARYGLSGGPRQKKADLIKALTGILG
jgi:hypothetical protein